MHDSDEMQPMDPIALTLAVWLGVIVSVTGLVRLSQNAAYEAALGRANTPVVNDDMRPMSMQLVGYGG